MDDGLKKLLDQYRLFLAYYYYLWVKDDESAEWVLSMSDETLLKTCLTKSCDEIIKFLREHLPNFDKEV